MARREPRELMVTRITGDMSRRGMTPFSYLTSFIYLSLAYYLYFLALILYVILLCDNIFTFKYHLFT